MPKILAYDEFIAMYMASDLIFTDSNGIQVFFILDFASFIRSLKDHRKFLLQDKQDKLRQMAFIRVESLNSTCANFFWIGEETLLLPSR
jgi:hypothetical protein